MTTSRKSIPWEAVIWLSALVALALLPVSSGDTHFTLCPVRNLGFYFCPGCGLGKSVSLLFHGEIRESFHTHPLGIFAVIILSFRTIHLTKLYYIRIYGKNN